MHLEIGVLLVVHFKGDQFYLSPHGKSIRDAGLPNFALNFPAVVSWTCRVVRVDLAERKLTLEIIHYHLSSSKIPKHQEDLFPQLQEIDTISFRSVDTLKLLACVDSNRGFSAVTTENVPDADEHVIKDFEISKAISDLHFEYGGVSLDYDFKGTINPVHIFIENPNLRSEYDAVKEYFVKELQTRKIQIFLKVEMKNESIEVIDAHSPEIDRISSQIIENVRFEFARSLKNKRPFPEVDKHVFTMDEYIASIQEGEFKSDTFYKNGLALFEDLLRISDSKHYRHLRHLASIHANHILKLRFVAEPISFIFLVEGKHQYHLIWETLDTEEATYIWHVEKTLSALKSRLKRIESIIQTVKIQGKLAYISEAEADFQRIFHDYSAVVDGFIRWKGKLEARLY